MYDYVGGRERRFTGLKKKENFYRWEIEQEDKRSRCKRLKQITYIVDLSDISEQDACLQGSEQAVGAASTGSYESSIIRLPHLSLKSKYLGKS